MSGFIPTEAPRRTRLVGLRRAALGSAAAILVLLSGCGSNSQPFNDTPAITNLFPSAATAGGAAFTLSITGTGFIQQSTAYWNNNHLTTTFNPNTLQLSASVPASDIATAGVAQVTVVSPSPGGGVSNAATFTINPVENPAPTIGSLSPSSTSVGALPPNGVLLVNGTNFMQASAVAFNGISRTAHFVGSTQLTVPMTSADVSANATISVTVSNPTPGGGVSNAVSFTVGTGSAMRLKTSVLASGAPFPEVVSLGALGEASDGESVGPAISADGRFVAFHSTATNLVTEMTSATVFVRDTCLGAADCMPQTVAVDLASDRSSPNAQADSQVAISQDGRFVAFSSTATNLVPGRFTASPTARVYVRDLCTGPNAPASCTSETQLVSVGAEGEALSGASGSPSISSDGRFVAFVSAAPGSGGVVASGGLWVRDTCAGPTADPACTPKTYSIAAAGEGGLSGDEFSGPAISGQGRYVAFVAENSLAATSQVVLADTCLGPDAPVGCRPSWVNVSVSADRSDLPGVNRSPSLNDDGRFVAFASQATGVAPNVLVRDTCLGTSAPANCVPQTTLVREGAQAPAISSTGRYVSYVAAVGNPAPNLGPLYLYDTCTGAAGGCTPQPYPVGGASVEAFTAAAEGPAPLSSDGGFIAFATSASIAGLRLSGQGDVLLSVTPF